MADRIVDLMAELEAALAAAKGARQRREDERRQRILTAMEAGEPVYVADAIWATNGACLEH